MTNFERYFSEIKEIVFSGKRIAKDDSGIKACKGFPSCIGCDFLSESATVHCSALCMQWMCEEYIEPIKLTRKQRKFLEFIETGWIVRYESGKLGWYAEKPMWDGFVWVNKPFAPILVIDTKIVDFPFIESENKEPFSVEKMLTLEVEE